MKFLPLALGLLLSSTPARAQSNDFQTAASNIQVELRQAMDELDALYTSIAEEKLPLGAELSRLQEQLLAQRSEFQATSRQLDGRTLELSNLRSEVKARQDEALYLRNLLTEYMRNFESRLHVAERQRYDVELVAGTLAIENTSLSEAVVYAAQLRVLNLSLDRLGDAQGGARFPGTALDPTGAVLPGSFLVVGPAGFFAADDHSVLGLLEQRLNSAMPAAVPFRQEADREAVSTLFANGSGALPFDPTLGNAEKMEATDETLVEHLKKGGAVMIPILIMAALALLVSLYKWLSMALQRAPSERQVRGLLEAVGSGDAELASKRAAQLKGTLGKMLSAGVRHMREPRDLVEEVMYEVVLTTRLKLNSYLPFISICAASAPLLGLLGTVTGIINTFKMITVFGSGDVKSLSGGISEALITTKFGLIVAIPSLLLHAFLSRKAKGAIDRMERGAIGLVNEIGKADPSTMATADLDVRLAGPQPRVFSAPADLSGLESLVGRLLMEQQQLAASVSRGQAELAELRNDLRAPSGASEV